LKEKFSATLGDVFGTSVIRTLWIGTGHITQHDT